MRNKILALMTAAVALGLVGKAIADGIPTVTPLTYTGVLQNSNGTAVTTQRPMQLTLWDDATANASVNQKCVTPTQNVTPDAQGRFQVQLDQACFDAVKANPNLWVQLEVGGMTLPRTKIGAVPYAVEAGRSTRQVISHAGKKRTVFGQYCGATAGVNGAVTASGGTIVGYPATKLLCEQTCSTATAHLCSGQEVTASLEIGLSPPKGWVSSSIYGQFSAGAGGVMLENGGFRFTNYWALVWAPAEGWIDAEPGTAVNPLLCCD